MKQILAKAPKVVHAIAGGIVGAGLALAPHIDGAISRGDWLGALLAFLGGAGLTTYTIPSQSDSE